MESRRLVPVRCELGCEYKEKNDHDRCIQNRMGGPLLGQARLRLVVTPGKAPTHKLSRDESGRFGTQSPAPIPQRRTCPGPNGQYDSGVLHKSPVWTQIELLARNGQESNLMVPMQPALAESSACTWRPESGGGHVIQGQPSPRRMVSPPSDGSVDMGYLRQSGSRPLCLQGKRPLPSLFLEEHGRARPRLAEASSVCFPPGGDVTTGHQSSQREKMCSALDSSVLENPDMVPRTDANDVINPDLWALHVWPLNGYLGNSLRE